MNESAATRWFELDPVDAWFFRDARPSNRGEDQSDLESIFPPHPTTVVGALRAALAREQGWPGHGDWPAEIKKVLGDGFENLGKLRFTGPFLIHCGELLFPMPSHVLGPTGEDDEGKTFTPTGWLQPEPVHCDLSAHDAPAHLPVLPRYHGKPESKPPVPAEGFFVTITGLQRILAGELPDKDHCVHRKALFRHESRVGIAFDRERPDSRVTGEGEIYSPRYVRLKQDVSLIVGVDGLPADWKVPSLLPLGGESRLAGSREITNDPPSLPQATLDADESTRSVLILLTPARFDGDNDDPASWIGAGPGNPASQLHSDLAGNVLTAAIDRPMRIGGWDFKDGPRPLEPFVPAGSVWWLDGPTTDNAPRLGTAPYTDYGYGHALLGCCPQNGS
jgi:CRISPR-associated protein Cmr3